MGGRNEERKRGGREEGGEGGRKVRGGEEGVRMAGGREEKREEKGINQYLYHTPAHIYTVLLMSHDTYHIITHQFTGIKYNREKYKPQETV